MKKIITLLCVCLAPFAAIAAGAPTILSESDVETYSRIFKLQSNEKIDAAIKLDGDIEDKILMNEVLYQRYFSKTYRTRGAQVAEWMNKYYNMPGAERMAKLAKRKEVSVRSAKLPRTINGKSIETAQSETWTAKKYSGQTATNINKFKKAIRTGSTKTARTILEDSKFKRSVAESDYGRLAGRLSFLYYTNGEYELAKKWGFVAADAKSEYGLWAMGLLYYKEEKFQISQKYFSSILDLKQINDARKIEAAFWAGRAAEQNDDKKNAKKYWEIGAKHPMSFYGALSSVMMGYTPYYEFFEQDLSNEDFEVLAENKYGKRALALLQLEQKERAEEYLKLMITSNASDRTLHAINSVSSAYNLPRVSMQVADVVRDRGILEIDSDIIYSAQYPLPDWEPMGGWSIDRALLFAITKQESNFKTSAKSSAGANGLMQLMPGTAKLVARRSKVSMADIDMSNPEHNMFLGQQHIVDLLAHPQINNNIIKMLATYNAGMSMVLKFEKNFDTSDPLLYIESFPAYETRSYVKRVMSNLWLYRARLNQPLSTMRELAEGRWPLYSSEDEYVKQQVLDRLSI
ncbi:lytic transglycosylase domain-containing protein [Lachnospiraceae bacterium OttesenSCG-928-E19]|nr:lytic transglycosylase domain-containing protein [Lachnospiraceae bacterium OttesenSCG-928-E19]